jgi:hypothetical protein
MAIKQFALPLEIGSGQAGDITSNATLGQGQYSLNLITSKDGDVKDHVLSVSSDSGNVVSTLTHALLMTIFNDAVDGDWDYIEAKWTVSAIDTPDDSKMFEVQSGHTYNLHGWPPHKK